MLAHLLRSSLVFFLLAFSLALPVNGEEKAADAESEASATADDAESKEPEGDKRVHLSPESMKQAALADESVKKQIVWLESAEGSEGEASSFLALELYESVPESQGAVLFLHGVEQHPNWPQVVKPLRTLLTEDGWYTLSIMLPYEHHMPAPSRDLEAKLNESVPSSDTAPRFSGRYSKFDNNESDSEDKGEESDSAAGEEDENGVEAEPTETAADLELKDASEEVIDISANENKPAPSVISFEEKVQKRLAAALEHITQKDYENVVVVGYQQGAQGVLDYLSLNKGFLPDKGLTVIWVDALLTSDQQSNFGDLIGEEFSLKMLDVVDSSSRTGVLNGKKRSGQAKRNSYAGYSLVKLPIADAGLVEASTLTQRIRGWLKVNAEGMNVSGN